MVRGASIRKARNTPIQVTELTPAQIRTSWCAIVNTVLKEYKLGDNDLRMVMDDALTRAGIAWEVEYNVKKLSRMDLSRFTPELFKTFTHAFYRAVNVLVETRTGYSISPFRTLRSTTEEVVSPEQPTKPKSTPRLRRSYSRRLRVK